MQDVMTHVFTNTTVTHQGYQVVTCTPTGRFKTAAPVINQGVTSGVHMMERLDEVRYYTASGAV